MFGKKLKHLREYRNMSQKELAEALSLSPSTIGMYEQGSRQPDHEKLRIIADYFGVTTDYLLGREEAYAEFLTQWEKFHKEKNFRELMSIGLDKFAEKYGKDKLEETLSQLNKRDNIGEIDSADENIQEIVKNIKNLKPAQIEILNQFIKSITEDSATKDDLSIVDEPHSKYDLIAASGNPNPMDDLPQESIDQIEELKRKRLEKYKKN